MSAFDPKRTLEEAVVFFVNGIDQRKDLSRQRGADNFGSRQRRCRKVNFGRRPLGSVYNHKGWATVGLLPMEQRNKCAIVGRRSVTPAAHYEVEVGSWLA